MVNSLGGPICCVGQSLRDLQGGELFSCVDRVSDMAPACLPVALLGEAQKRDNGFCLYVCLGESWPPAPALTLQFLPVCHWCLSSYYPGAGVQRELVWVSPCVGFLKGTAWDSRGFFHQLNPCWLLQPEFVGTYLPDTGTLDLGAWCGARTPCSCDILPEFTACGCGTSPFCVSALPTCLDGCGFFNSIVARLSFSLNYDGSEW